MSEFWIGAIIGGICVLPAILGVFAGHWIADPSFRDWWRNQPTISDPDRWERFKRERGQQ